MVEFFQIYVIRKVLGGCLKDRDGFEGNVELETHMFGEQQVAASHDSMEEIVWLLDKRKSWSYFTCFRAASNS